ncbi:YL1 nuclear [Ascosphaera apis ARSEF 7405]|uniref:YL1 nuclear n=1 Tax=Ascosphaera apis ARSEF 7405 TaxID=392613 RepID=A0A168A6E8_9EURO|nr:YL1 nuclear [Ascosphaera apis ARSEF 7405]
MASSDVEMKDRPSEEAASSSSDEEPSLAITRSRRSTAGARMSALIDAEADDELALLFAEDEDDAEFELGRRKRGGLPGEEGEDEDEGEEDDAEDIDMSSSSDDDEDKGPNAPENEELEGEQELLRQTRAEAKRKKKKADESLRLTALRKRAMVSSAAARASKSAKAEAESAGAARQAELTAAEEAAALAKKRKKSERTSWLPTIDDIPTRSSSRRQTMANKEQTHARLKDSEEKRVRLIATMEKAAKRKEKLKAKVMTQADRLEEAKRTERLNSKSLNRWEEMERKRIEEQQERLRALQNRRLEGAVVTYWSGPAKWADGKLVQVGITEVHEREEPVSKKRKLKDIVEGKAGKAGKLNRNSIGPVIEAIKTEDNTRPNTAQNAVVESEPVSAVSGSTAFPDSSRPQSRGQPQDNGFRAQISSPAENDDSSTALLKNGDPQITPSSHQSPEPLTDSQVQRSQPISVVPADPPLNQNQDQSLPQNDKGASSCASNTPPIVPAGQDTQFASAIPKHEADSKPVSAIFAAPPCHHDSMNIASNRLLPLASVHAHSIPLYQSLDSHTIQQTQSSGQGLSSVPPTGVAPVSTTESQAPLQPIIPEPMDIDETPHVPVIEHTSRESYIFTDIDHLTTEQKAEYAVFLENQNPQDQPPAARTTTSRSKSTKPPRSSKPVVELCPITSKPAKYRDPLTNLAYASALAYKEIHETLNNRYAWSSVLGCFCGPIGVGARGVPERFLAPNTVPKDIINVDTDDDAGGVSETVDGNKSGSTSVAGTGTAGNGTPVSASAVQQQQQPQIQSQPQNEQKPMVGMQQPQQQPIQQTATPVGGVAVSGSSAPASGSATPTAGGHALPGTTNQGGLQPAVSSMSYVPATAPTPTTVPVSTPSAAPQTSFPSGPAVTGVHTSTAAVPAPTPTPTTSNPMTIPAHAPMSSSGESKIQAPVQTSAATTLSSASTQTQSPNIESTRQQEKP